MSQNESRFELAEHLDQDSARSKVISECAIRNLRNEKLGPEEVRARRHFFPALRGQISSRAAWLSFVTLAENANGHSGPIRFGPGKGAGAKQIRIVRMRDHSKNAFGFKG